MKTKTLLLVLVLSSGLAYGQTMYLSGPSTVDVNDQEYYYANFDFPPDEGDFYWNADGGTVINPDWYYDRCEVQWTRGGEGWVYYLYESWDNYWEDGYQVYVTAPVPGAPTAGGATYLNNSSFTANWTNVTGASSYLLDVSTSSTFSSFLSGYHDGTALHTYSNVYPLSGGTTYYFRVRAQNQSGISGYSNTKSVLTLPDAPNGNNASDITPTSFTANWGSVPSATGYRLDVSTVSTFSSFVTGYNDLSVTGTSQSMTGLSAGTTYYYRVRALNESGTSANSATQSVLTFPAAPTATYATFITTNSFRSNWTSVPSATGYRLDVSTVETFSSFVSGYNDLPAAQAQNVTGLSAGITYYYRVRAVNASGASADSNTKSVVTVPPAPIANDASSISTNSFAANWSSAMGALGYELDVSTTSTFLDFVTGYNVLYVSATSQSVTGLSEGTIYYYRVRAENLSGTSADSNTKSVVTIPGAPTANDPSNITTNSFTANWTSVPSGTSYQLDVSTISTFPNFVPGYNSLPVTGTSYNVTGLSAGTGYYYRVRAVNASGASQNSNMDGGETLPEAPTPSASNITASSFTISWPSLNSTYQLDVSTVSRFRAL